MQYRKENDLDNICQVSIFTVLFSRTFNFHKKLKLLKSTPEDTWAFAKLEDQCTSRDQA